MSAGRWNQSALKPHLVSNGKNIKDYYPRRQKGHEHLPHRVRAKFRRTIFQGNSKNRTPVSVWKYVLSCRPIKHTNL